ncbi:MAG: IMPACT family protein [Wenzhouxiangella sp.]
MKCLTEPAVFETTVKRSRFIARAARIEAEAELGPWIDRQRDPSANHHCWAWRSGTVYRFDDDGEPGGTAGRPILQAIEGQGFDHTAVVVIRHFGGIKLGTGGLIRAYGGTAAECLRLASSEPLVTFCDYQCRLPFDCLGLAWQIIDRYPVEQVDSDFDAGGVVLTLRLPAASREGIHQELVDASRGRLQTGD